MVLIFAALCSTLGQYRACVDVVCTLVIMLLTDECSTFVARTAAGAIKQWVCNFATSGCRLQSSQSVPLYKC